MNNITTIIHRLALPYLALVRHRLEVRLVEAGQRL